MANWIQRLFGSGDEATNTQDLHTAPVDYGRLKQSKVERLRELIAETILLYNSTACPCAFPRFRQIAGLDCIDYRCAFSASETELLIETVKPFYNQVVIGPKNNEEEWTCKKCGSLWYFNWEDFSILVSRNVLQIKDLRVADAGAAATVPIPLYVGLSGHRFPDRTKIAPVDFDTFKDYLQQKA